MKIETRNIDAISVLEKDLPPSGNYPPQSEKFEELVRTIKREGMLIPVFVSSSGTCLGGHHRLWAARVIPLKEVPVVVVKGKADIDKWFEGP